MKTIYITVLVIFMASVALFVFSFVYLDTYNHRILYYDIALDGQSVGTIKIDKFITEERLIYKSIARMPSGELFTESRIRLDLDRKYDLEDYQKDLSANNASYLFYAENKKGLVSFVSRLLSRFASLSDMPVRRGTFVFEEDSPVTYLPIIENYDFRRGRAQGFNSLIYLSDTRLPPVNGFVTLTSIRDEYVKIGRRKIKTEDLILKIKGLPSGSVWVAKSDRSIIMIEIQSIGLRITRSFEPGETAPKKPMISPDTCLSKDIVFQNNKIQLSGTLTIPKADVPAPNPDDKYPVVLLIAGSGPQDRDYEGLFESIASYLPKYGYCVLRFDRRGIGSSGGDAGVATPDTDLEDLAAAVNFLKTQGNIDPDRIILISHSDGALNALRLAAGNTRIKGIVLMAPHIAMDAEAREEILKAIAARERWDDKYLKLALRAIQETRDRAVKTKRDWTYILGKKCDLRAVREMESARPIEAIEKISSPILILQGRNDAYTPSEYAIRLDKALAAHGNMKHTLTCFDHLGDFFGKLINDGVSKMRYDIDKDVLAGIRDWLNLNTVKVVKEGAAPAPGSAVI